MAANPVPRHIDAVDPLDKRIALLGLRCEPPSFLPLHSKDACDDIRIVIHECGEKLVEAIRRISDTKYDIGRVINALDKLLEARESATVSLTLPHLPVPIKLVDIPPKDE